jgi:recombination protein RecT
MYRAGYVSSVIVSVVRENDEFTFVPGEDDRPHHKVDWFGDRGALKGVYAYANMRDGAVSNVVVLNRQQVMEAKAKSPGANSQHSPWQTFEEQMWLKTGARRLEKWVPVSNSIRAFGTRPATWAGEHSSFGSDTGNARVTVQAELVEADDDNTLHYEPEDGE